MRRIICVILIFAFVLASASFAFAEGLTTSQATSIFTELTSLSGNYIKSFLFNIQRSLTATASNGVLYELQRISSSLRGSGNDGHPATLWGLLDRALYGNHDLLGSGWQGIGYYVHKLATDGFALDSAISDKLTYNDTSIAELVSRIGNVQLSSGHFLTKIPTHSDASPTGIVSLFETTSSMYPLLLSNGYISRLYTVSNPQFQPETVGDWFNLLNTNLIRMAFINWGRGVDYYTTSYNYDGFSVEKNTAISLADFLDINLGSIVESTGRLSAFFVDEDELQAKKDNKDVISGAVQGFLSPGESASLSGSNVLEFKGSFDAVQNGFGSSASAADSFSVLNSGSETYSWFSQSTADDLDSVGSGSTLRALGSDTPALDQYYQDVLFGIHFFD